ncbi:hypothetical protein EGW08_010602 [Elysia chlorotica]|uniref:Proline-rich transmembrane protein 1 n=1 Tax=Elysia chlorotica TaxID=188477 RepID=A0A433TJ85_ELYCH|nr:hypothetical protein EGW08_010602 [Elysia chlorotica]
MAEWLSKLVFALARRWVPRRWCGAHRQTPVSLLGWFNVQQQHYIGYIVDGPQDGAPVSNIVLCNSKRTAIQECYNPDMPAQGYPPQPPPQYYQGQPGVVPQPQTMIIQREGEQVQDNLVIAIVSIFFCCIIGIIATIKASNSKDSVRRGDIAKAQEESVSARKLAIAAIITGIVIAAISIFVNVILPLILVGVSSS